MRRRAPSPQITQYFTEANEGAGVAAEERMTSASAHGSAKPYFVPSARNERSEAMDGGVERLRRSYTRAFIRPVKKQLGKNEFALVR
jgi:hypothetical protein